MKRYPALDVDSTSELLLALVDDCSPTAVEPLGATTRLFFGSQEDRSTAAAALHAAGYRTRRVDIDDEDWARRSQENLAPVTVGRITVAAPWHEGQGHGGIGESEHKGAAVTVVIVPSMGFGTGHHETTRLCLEALQGLDLRGATVLDAGTGSGVLAIAASRLGASEVVGIDNDEDALQAARQNLALNPEARHVSFETRDVTSSDLPRAHVVTANLTGALLLRLSDKVISALRPGGIAILSGVLAEERDAVRRAFSAMETVSERQDGEWVGLVLKKA